MLIIDDFLSNNGLISKVKDKSFWERRGKYNWWDGWWKVESRNPAEELIAEIWQSASNVEGKIAGFEYWSNGYLTATYLGWHQDKDERLFTENGTINTPNSGQIFYLDVSDLEGGYLEISNEKSKGFYPEFSDIERIKPVENRLIMFDPSVPHRVSKIYSGKRRALLANAWGKKPETFRDGDSVTEVFDPVPQIYADI